MNLNHNLFISLILSIILFYIGLKLRNKLKASRYKNALLVISLILAVPGFSMVTYYFHLIDSPHWYIEFRAIPNIECINSFIGLFMGFAKINSKSIALSLTVLMVVIPFSKPIIRPITLNLESKWINDVCIQSSPASCGPSSLATIFQQKGIRTSEEEIAAASYTCSSGTEIWYLLRHASGKGLNYSYKHIKNIHDVETPCIIGTNISGIGHFITVLETTRDKYVIGDPLIGKIELTIKEFEERYELDGLMIHFK